MTSGTPQMVGSIHRRTATQLAEAAIEAIAQLTPNRGQNAGMAFEVGLDVAGRVLVDRLGNTPRNEWLMTCTRKSDPDALADEIRAEVADRDPKPVKRRVVRRARAEMGRAA